MATYTPSDLTDLTSTVTRKRTSNGTVFRTTTYYVRRADFDLMACGKPPEHSHAYRSIDDGPRKAFRMRLSVPSYRKMLAAHARDRHAHTLGARQMEADWSC